MKIKYILYFLILFQISSCKKGEIPQGLITKSVDLINYNLLCKASIEKTGSSRKNSTMSGFCWGTDQNPTIDNQLVGNASIITKTKNITFSNEIRNFLPDKLYYIRSFAKNNYGVAYGNEISFMTPLPTSIKYNSTLNYNTVSDNEGTLYKTITIGTQTWMAENLKTKHYNDNSLIPIESCPAFELNENLVNSYGRLYSHDVIDNSAGVCPTGWHIPIIGEWNLLLTSINNDYQSIIEKSDEHWYANSDANNSTGFTAMPSGIIINSESFQLRNKSYWWSETAEYIGSSFFYALELGQDYHIIQYRQTTDALSIRCVKD